MYVSVCACVGFGSAGCGRGPQHQRRRVLQLLQGTATSVHTSHMHTHSIASRSTLQLQGLARALMIPYSSHPCLSPPALLCVSCVDENRWAWRVVSCPCLCPTPPRTTSCTRTPPARAPYTSRQGTSILPIRYTSIIYHTPHTTPASPSSPPSNPLSAPAHSLPCVYRWWRPRRCSLPPRGSTAPVPAAPPCRRPSMRGRDTS